VAEIARDLGFNDTTLGNWVKADGAEHVFLTRLVCCR
jgi:transposase-like protein